MVRHMQSSNDAPEMIPDQNLLMVNQTVIIASVAASVTWCSGFDLLSISTDFNVKITVILILFL